MMALSIATFLAIGDLQDAINTFPYARVVLLAA